MSRLGVLPNASLIRYLRQARGWSQEELAAEAGCSKTTIVRLEQGEQLARLSTLREVAHALHTDVEAIFVEPTTPAPSQSQTIQADKLYRLVGREAELSQLRTWFDVSCQGARQIGFISGEPGIGKTALVETFIVSIAEMQDAWFAYGQCVDHYGAGEPYLPILEALGRLCRGPHGATIIAILRQFAPSWLIQMPALLSMSDRDQLRRLTIGTTSACMLRELAEALEVLTAERPLVLVLEDLHWCDEATLGWLAYVARRRDTARLLVLGTYRPVDATVVGHVLTSVIHELRQQGRCVELPLDYLSETGIAAYLQCRFGPAALPPDLTTLLHQRTNGNPLFLIAVLEDLLYRDILAFTPEACQVNGGIDAVKRVVPESLRRLIVQQMDQLPPGDQHWLEAASVEGRVFTAATVAACCGVTVDELERQVTNFTRAGRFVEAFGADRWPDGTMTTCYRFLHAMYREVIYQRMSEGQRLRRHGQIGRWKASAYGNRAFTIAGELAVHFDRAQDVVRAIYYRQHAVEHAIQRSAYVQAHEHLNRGFVLLPQLPELTERMEKEFILQATQGRLLMATKGYTAPEVLHAFSRAAELAPHVGETPEYTHVLWGIAAFYLGRGTCITARELGESILSIAQRQGDTVALSGTLLILGACSFYLGDFAAACHCFQRAWASYNSEEHLIHIARYSHDSGVMSLLYLAMTLWLMGHLEQAVAYNRQAQCLARELQHPFSRNPSLFYTVVLQSFQRNLEGAHALVQELMRLAAEYAFPHWETLGSILHGCLLIHDQQPSSGIDCIEVGLAARRAQGAGLAQPWILGQMAEGYLAANRFEEGLLCLEEALKISDISTEHWWEGELWRLQGELLLNQGERASAAEDCFQQGLDIARRQQAKSLELRAAISMGRLWRQQGKFNQAKALLATVYDWFQGGLDAPDVRDAKALLDALSS